MTLQLQSFTRGISITRMRDGKVNCKPMLLPSLLLFNYCIYPASIITSLLLSGMAALFKTSVGVACQRASSYMIHICISYEYSEHSIYKPENAAHCAFHPGFFAVTSYRYFLDSPTMDWPLVSWHFLVFLRFLVNVPITNLIDLNRN